MVHYKLIYFNLRARGELIRLILKLKNVSFEDFRIELKDWPNHKDGMMFGQVPIFEVDGKPLAQSHSIARYLARQHGLAGNNEWDQAQADMYIDCLNDIINGMRPLVKESDPVKKREFFLKYHQETIDPHLQTIEKHLAKNGTGFLVGNSITWADLGYFAFFQPMGDRFNVQVIEKYPHFKKLVDHVGAIPQIKQHVETRPKTEL